MTVDEARVVAAEAFLFGYPLVLMDVTCAAMGAVNTLTHLRAFPDASFKSVVSPNADTLYSTAPLDLSGEPLILSVHDSGGRYYLLPILSGWTDVFASPGTRTTGNGAGRFALVGPRWSGELPAGVQELRSPTALAWMIGRTQTNGKADYESVHRFQDGLRLEPLAPAAERQPDIPVDATSAPPKLVDAMDAATFFGRVASLMVENPPADADAPVLARFAQIGLAPGTFEPDPALEAALEQGVQAAREGLEAAATTPVDPKNGWTIHSGLGEYGTDYAKRALVALVGLGANLTADAVYPFANVDGAGQPFDGAHRYVMRFAPGQTPPARAFWSLTMYDADHYFVDNPLDRYAIGDRDQLAFGADGSLELLLQHDSPGAERESNWLPAPDGPFNLILRIYWPDEAVIDAGWAPPPIEKSV